MHSGIVNRHKLLGDAHTVSEQHRGTAAVFYFTRYCPFPLFSFYVFVSLVVCVIEDSRLFCDSPTGHLSVEILGITALK